jgi:lipid-A-disaccharide synthase
MTMRIFISAGEPSGDVHGANLVRTLQQLHPGVECIGFGGERMAAAGCRLLYPLSRLAVMWFARVLANVPTFADLLSRVDRYFRHHRPDAVVLIDYPGFHWWLARRAHFHGIPVFYFVPPQLWAWAGWRVKKMQRYVDHVLCNLPFEERWYHDRGVNARYVGHPYFDELPGQRLDRDFLARHEDHRRPVIALLPGSRGQEVVRNLPMILKAAARIHAARPDTRFLVACYKEAHAQTVSAAVQAQLLPVEVCTGRTPEIIALAHACIAVSGSVGLELLYRSKPSVVVYRIGRLDLRLGRLFMTSPYISLVNLLAEKELFPEYLTDHCEAGAIADKVLTWLNDPAAYAAVCEELASLRQRVAAPGACERTAGYILDVIGRAERSKSCLAA